MANEAQVRAGLNVRIVSGSVVRTNYRNDATYQADVSAVGGPTPGSFLVDAYGVDVDFSQLTTPGLAWLHNQDAVNYVEFGIYDPADDSFDPLGEILPGESFPFRFSRNLGESYEGTGTGTSAATKRVRFRANGGSCWVLVDAFEK